jgi:signal transduction histidine kinase
MLLPLLLSLLASVLCATLATAILARDSTHGASRLSAAMLYGAAFWAGCEVMWTVTPDADTALALVKLSALGWVLLGPMSLHLVIEVLGDPAERLRRRLPHLYAVSGCFLLLDWTTHWIHPAVVRTDAGWGYELGPAYALYWLFTISTMCWGLYLGARAHRRLPSAAERKQVAWIGVGFVVPLVVASVTDGILPWLGVQVLRLGTPSFVVLGITIAWSLHRYGYALLAPAAYSAEIVGTMREGLVMLRLDGRIRTANSAMAHLAGCRRTALAGLRIQDLLDVDPVTSFARDGEIECVLSPLQGTPMPVSISTTILRNREGEPSGCAMLVRDLREVTGLRERLLLSGRMAAVGQLAAGVAHEINNPVAYVRANLVMLRQHWESLRELPNAGNEGPGEEKPEDEFETIWGEGLELIDESLEGVARTAAIVRGIREFSHAGNASRESVDLNDLVRSAQRMAKPRLQQHATLALDLADLPPVSCSPREIQQVILNLLINAADATGEGGNIRLSTRREGEQLRLSVNDDGDGIPVDAIGRIFDPFFTTKDVGEGTGLGLSISYEIVTRHDGDITVESKPGKGTTFTVKLPIDPAQI